MELETARLHIREWTTSDIRDLHPMFNDDQVQKYMYLPYFTLTETEAFVRSMIESRRVDSRSEYFLAVTARDDRSFLGWCAVAIRDLKEREGEVGFAFIPSAWGKGFATEAAQAVLNLAFGELKLHRVFAFAHPENRGSRRVLEKMGMLYEGTLRQNKWARTAWRDSVIYAMLESEWHT